MRRLLIVDDHPIFRHGLRQALEDAGGFDSILEAGTGAEAATLLSSEVLQVVIVDIGLPDISGLDLIEDYAGRPNAPAFFVLTTLADTSLARKAFRQGASGFASKNIALSILQQALRLIAAGELYVEGELLRDILTAEFQQSRVSADFAGRLASLSERERTLLEALLEGLTAKEAATRLGVSQRTAENYQSQLYRKIGARTPVELVRFAFEAGMLMPGSL